MFTSTSDCYKKQKYKEEVHMGGNFTKLSTNTSTVVGAVRLCPSSNSVSAVQGHHAHKQIWTPPLRNTRDH